MRRPYPFTLVALAHHAVSWGFLFVPANAAPVPFDGQLFHFTTAVDLVRSVVFSPFVRSHRIADLSHLTFWLYILILSNSIIWGLAARRYWTWRERG